MPHAPAKKALSMKQIRPRPPRLISFIILCFDKPILSTAERREAETGIP
jgi:hypothetical protein